MLTSAEVASFLRYVTECPIDDQSNHHLPIATMTALTANINRGKGTKAYSPMDFMVFKKKEEQELSIDEQLLHGEW